jgi:hypothetical protein
MLLYDADLCVSSLCVPQAEAATAQRAFEHSRVMLEGQLSQLSSAITSQEALIATLQANEAEAKNLGALYLVSTLGFGDKLVDQVSAMYLPLGDSSWQDLDSYLQLPGIPCALANAVSLSCFYQL